MHFAEDQLFQTFFFSPFLANSIRRTRVIEHGARVQIFTRNILGIIHVGALNLAMLTNRTCARCAYVTRISRRKFFVAKEADIST